MGIEGESFNGCDGSFMEGDSSGVTNINGVPEILENHSFGIEVSIIRFRTSSFWSRGFNHTFLYFPPRIIPLPNVKRMAIVCSNLGNWSSLYFNVPNHTITSPILGFQIYVSSATTLIRPKKMKKMNLSFRGDPITIRFPQIDPKDVETPFTPICAKFGENGSIELSNMSMPYVCVTSSQSQGHYALVVPKAKDIKRENDVGIWWVVGLGLGIIVGLVVLGFGFVGAYKMVKKRWIGKLERNSQRNVPFDTFWVGESKMPSASMTRTQAVLENEYPPSYS
ncbi:plant/F17O14-7 protein [Senna tora]|uniref:Plant/F17O14-7 protein n=1 Tax=Senna tora TaxID=362788 RepID=A0A834XF14_9FABA|nr:plant/F17O14-7 protein [Senna tora]